MNSDTVITLRLLHTPDRERVLNTPDRERVGGKIRREEGKEGRRERGRNERVSRRS